MNARFLLFGAVLLTACSQKFDGPPATQCDQGLAVATSSGWTCTPTSQLTVGSVTSADSVAHADSTASAGQVNAASDAGVADGFANDAHIWLGAAPADPSAKVSLASGGIEIDSHSVPAALFRGPFGGDLHVGGGGSGGHSANVPVAVGAGQPLFRIRASGRIVVNKNVLCRVSVQLGGIDVASTLVKATPEAPNSWYVEGKGSPPLSSGQIQMGVKMDSAGTPDAFCSEGPSYPGAPLPYVVVEAMNHAG